MSPRMIVRSWRGVAAEGGADAYVTHLRDTVVPQLKRLSGFRRLDVLRRGRTFRVLTAWDSMDAVRAFAADPEKAVVHADAQAVLAEWDDFVEHHEVDLQAEGLLQAAATMGMDYLASIGERHVAPSAAALAGLAAFDEPTPEGPTDPAAVLRQLNDSGGPATVATAGGRYFGFVVGGALPVTVAAGWLATAWDQNAVLHVLSPVANHLEDVCERWLLDLLGLPADAAVGYVTGASEGTFVALAAARHELLRRAGWDVNRDGLYGAPPVRVVVGAEAHSCVPRALRLLGMGAVHCEAVPVDQQGRMRADALPSLDDRTLVITQAGHVGSGASDPFPEICARARAAGAWVHVEGAFGIWAAVSPKLRGQVAGYELADSWELDAHKWLNVPQDSGMVIVRDRAALLAAMDTGASYIQFSDARDGCRYTPALSRRARGIEVWAALKSLGRTGLAALIEGTHERALQLADGLRDAGFTILNDVVLNQVLVEGDAALARRIQETGECWCGTTQWRGREAIRVSISSWATTAADIDRTIAAFVSAGASS